MRKHIGKTIMLKDGNNYNDINFCIFQDFILIENTLK